MRFDIKKYSDFEQNRLLLERGGFRQFLDGIGQGLKGLLDKSVLGDLTNKGIDPPTAKNILEAAENLRTSVQYAATEIDNVIAFIESTGSSDYGDIEKVQKKLREIYTYLVKDLTKEISSGKALSSIKKKLDGYSDEMKLILGEKKYPGLISKWKDEQLGKGRESVISSEFLSTGKNLVNEAKSILQRVSNRIYMEKKAGENNALNLLKKAVGAIRGDKETSDLPSRTEKKSDKPASRKEYRTFSRIPKESEKGTVISYQRRLKDLGYLKDYTKGDYDQVTKDAESKAMSFMSKITGKKYSSESEDDFREFQRDLGYYVDNKEVIRKKLGLS